MRLPVIHHLLRPCFLGKWLQPFVRVCALVAPAFLVTSNARAEELPPSGTLLFTSYLGLQSAPGYFGSADEEISPDIRFDVLYFRNRNFVVGQPGVPVDPNTYPTGIVPRLSFRYIAPRDPRDHPELAGLDDIDLSFEMGIGVGVVRPDWEAFADIRYGAIGHQSLVGELSAFYILRPSDRLALRIGPRLVYGSSQYNRTYFGVTPAEAAASSFPTFTPSSGVTSASVELIATYQLNSSWWVEMIARHERFSDDIARSPIVQNGRRDQTEISIGFRRVFQLRL